jgi:hypothetical protein
MTLKDHKPVIQHSSLQMLLQQVCFFHGGLHYPKWTRSRLAKKCRIYTFTSERDLT